MPKLWLRMALLLGIFTALLWSAADADLIAAEGRAAYIVRDALPLNVAPREALRALRTNISLMLARSAAEPLPLRPAYAVLDVWALLVGESILALRALAGLGLVLLAAATLRGWRRPLSSAGGGVLIALALVAWLWLRPTAPNWQAALHTLNAERGATTPLVTVYPPTHPLAYYDRQPGTHFRHGLALDLGWRAQTDADWERVAGVLRDAADMWWILPSDTADTLLTALANTHRVTWSQAVGDVHFMRLER